MTDSTMRAVGWAQSFPVSQGVRAGRHWARGHLASLEWAERSPDTVDSVLIAVSELITNAHRHARSDAQLVLTWDSTCLHVSVHDSSPQPPVPRDAGPGALGGRGMAIVDALADSWHHHPQRDGKTVTACFVPPGYEELPGDERLQEDKGLPGDKGAEGSPHAPDGGPGTPEGP